MTALETTDEGWVVAGDYTLKIDSGKIIARNAKGRTLKSVPAKAKKEPAFEKLQGLVSFVAQHEKECADSVSSWFLGNHPVPVKAIQAIWPDTYWRRYLHNLIISDGQTEGLLRDVTDAGLGIVDLDGESLTMTNETITIPHPAVIEDLEDWREFTSELGATQGLDQLFREIHRKPTDTKGRKDALRAYTDGKYQLASHLMGRARGGGFQASLGSVVVAVREAGQTIEGILDVYAYDPYGEAEIGELSFASRGKQLKAEEVGPIAWSEAIRMCEYIYAGRTVEEKEK